MDDLKYDLKYNEDGFLIVAEFHKCPFWEKDTSPCAAGWNHDCFFCSYADFRKLKYIKQLERDSKTGLLYSVCHNEKNRKKEQEKDSYDALTE